nr:excisionase [uncultured Caproiciproducens sp.]
MADGMKRYMLMHKNIQVADIELDEASSAISAIGHIYKAPHVPLGIPVKKGVIDRSALNEWWRGRAIPASRAGIKNALTELNLSTTQKLLEKCLGLSLSDQYWICPAGSGIQWSPVNFFDNPFSEDVGNILFGQGSSNDHMSLMSPDNTSDGWLKKKWKIIDGKRCLIKGGSGATQQEPYNEVMAGKIMDRLGIPHVPYTLLTEDEYPYSVCEDFITPQTELISAWYVMQMEKKPNHVSIYQHYLDCCEKLGISGMKEALDRMMVLDYLIVNEDRHQNNFGVVRNAETLAYLGAAPIFDSGTSLWFDKPISMIGSKAKLSCKPFKNNHEEQIKLVSSFDWLNLNSLYDIDEELRELMRGSVFIDSARCDALCFALRERVEMLTEVVNTRRTWVPVDDHHSDVTEDTAYSGKENLEQ